VYTWLISDGMHMEVGFPHRPAHRADDGGGDLRVAVRARLHHRLHGAMDPGYNTLFSATSRCSPSPCSCWSWPTTSCSCFFGWEAGGPGVVSLLIGFWYTRPSAIFANLKAFIVNRIGGLRLRAWELPASPTSPTRSRYRDAFAAAPQIAHALIAVSSTSAVGALTLICICLFIGAMGKFGAGAAARVAARLDGGSDPHLRAHSCRHHGDGRDLHGGAHVTAVSNTPTRRCRSCW